MIRLELDEVVEVDFVNLLPIDEHKDLDTNRNQVIEEMIEESNITNQYIHSSRFSFSPIPDRKNLHHISDVFLPNKSIQSIVRQ